MSEKRTEPTKERLSKRTSICRIYADKIHKTNPTLDQIEGALLRVFDTGYSEGYEDSTADFSRMREYRERKLNEGFSKFRDEVEDKIHQNK